MKIHSLLTGVLAMLCFTLAIYAGQQMSNQLFWGHYPLFLVMGSWLGIVLMVKSLKRPNTQSMFLFGCSLLSGLLLAKGFVYTSPLLFIGFIPLLILQHRLETEDPRASWKIQMGYAFNTFMVWNIGATYWVANAALVPGIVAFVLNSFFMCIPWMGMIWFGRKYPKLKYLSFIAFWICFEWAHQSWDLSWPWLSLGNGLAFIPNCIQWYDITGTFGGSLWILLINILIFQCIILKDYHWKRIGLIALILGIPILISLYKYYNFKDEGSSVEVAIVQPNYESHYEKFSVPQDVQMLKFKTLSQEVVGPNTRYLLWPETCFEFIQTDQFESDWRIQSMREFIQNYPHMNLVAGITSIKTFKPGEKLTDAARKNKRDGQLRFYEVQNSAIQISNTNKEIPLYVKSKLVPGVESFPYRKFLPFLKPIIDKLNGTVEGLGKQKERSVFQQDSFKIAPAICYESIYGNYIGDYIRKGAQAIFIMTNDGWWDDTPGYRQHLAFGALRAIEFRRPIARSANTGVSCFINARGDILQATSYGKDAAISKRIVFSNTNSFYLLTGDLIAYVCVYLTIAFVSMAVFIFWKARFSKNQ